MKDKCLSIEQMRHLKELSVGTSKASMVWSYRQSKECAERKSCPSLFVVGTEPNWETNLLKTVSVPAFTLQDILDLFPNTIELLDHSGMRPPTKQANTFTLRMNKGDSGSWYFSYVCEKYGAVSFDGEVMDAAYQMLCWVAENGYLTTKNQPQ